MTLESPKKSRFKKRDFWVRVISALILVTVTLASAVMGGVWFTLLVVIATAAMGREWVRMSDPGAPKLAYVFAIIGLLIPVILASQLDWGKAFIALFVATVIAALERIRRGNPWRAVGGLLYIGTAVIAILYISFGPIGVAALFYLFSVVWATDSAAYLVGSQVQGPKLWPSISPNKTWSGFAGGIVAGVVAGGITARLLGYDDTMMLEVVSMILALVSVGGDLLSSWLKRRFGVKDTGTSIPGHGGVLDRLDALLAAGILLAVLIRIFWGFLFV